MQQQVPSLGRMAVMVGFTLSCFGLLLFLWESFGGPIPLKPEGYRFTAFYREATQLAEQADVRISGVSVGKVVDLRERGGLTRAEIELDSRYAPIPADTRTILRLKTLLGETYVELTPGTPPARGGRALPDGGELPPGQTRPTVELDEVLRAFDARTRRQATAFLRELADAVEGRAPDISASLGNLGPTVDDAGELAAVLNSQRRAVRRLVADGATVLGALSEREGALRSLVDSGSQVLAATASRDRALTETVRILPTFLGELRPTLSLAQAVGAEAEPLLDELRPAGEHFSPSVRALHAASPELRALFRDLAPVVERSRTALPALTSILSDARPLVGRLHPASRDAVPVVDWVGLQKREVVTAIVKVAVATQATAKVQGGSAIHLLRVLIPITQEALASYPTRLPQNRHNPYAKPGYLEQIGRPHLKAFDCANSSGSEAGAPPCVEQGPFELPGFRGIYPQLREDGP